ncbi:hypothetical protein DY000_02000068 [Brassica cretica]|uniref:Uncharacterized protein n=1 Tax=Brassica cretica TaxID=69181 RepID=A0ABQ7C5K1_BRACR|nr:hypothetical protein DY000_02000068 [Brassica cretica]
MAFLNSNHVLRKAVSRVTLLGCSTMAGRPGDFTLPLQAVKIISYLAQTESQISMHARDSTGAKRS